ncbi:site-specific DNA-methyltransferase [Paraburkholderia phenoliruptrix]|uniref:site-specific DNA-methyltransferase n=1 Tax=Paraburkholderia phenoliruptrix TaxID=252970 RepID=UPI0034D02037
MSDAPYTLHLGDCIEVMRSLPDSSIDAVVTDPPYGIRFMGKAWDGSDIEARHLKRKENESHSPGAGPNGGHKSIAAEAGKYDLAPQAMRAFQEFSREWALEAFRVLKPGGHLLSFSSARTYHRMASGIEDAGFELRDQIMWLYGSGFPKSLNVAKAIESGGGRPEDIRRMTMGEGYAPSGRGRANYDHGAASAMNGETGGWAPTTDAARQWEGWGTALKPAHEPICVARKPFAGTVAANVLAHGVGALNIEACRIETTENLKGGAYAETGGRTESAALHGASGMNVAGKTVGREFVQPSGRWPANVIHDGSDEVLAAFPDAPGQIARSSSSSERKNQNVYGAMVRGSGGVAPRADIETSAARFFYCAKASRADRNEGLGEIGPQFKKGTTLRAVEVAAAAGELKGNTHPTVKPTELMRYLCRLVTPAGGVVLDPFMGSGSTGKAAMLEGFRFVGIDMTPEYVEIARARIGAAWHAAEAVRKVCAPAPQMDLFLEEA